jgi:L-rhamnose mutarotase
MISTWKYYFFVLLILAGCNGFPLHPQTVKRYASVTGLKPEFVVKYKQLHAHVWPGVLKRIRKCHIHNYSIYLKEIDGKTFLFSYFEYSGNNFQEDMKLMAEDSLTRMWWKQTDPTQQPLPDALKQGKIWSEMKEVFHTD